MIYFSVTRASVSKWVMWLILNSHSKENMRSDQPNTKHSDWRALQFFNQSKQVILKNFSKNIFQVQKYLNLYRERKEGKEEKEKKKKDAWRTFIQYRAENQDVWDNSISPELRSVYPFLHALSLFPSFIYHALYKLQELLCISCHWLQ